MYPVLLFFNAANSFLPEGRRDDKLNPIVDNENGISAFLRMLQMRNGWIWVLAAAVVVLAGCENPELVTCHQDNQMLRTQADALAQQLSEASISLQQKDQQIEQIKAEHAEMQTKAMESIMAMLQKEGQRSKKLQDTVAQKDRELKAASEKTAALEQTIRQLQQEVNSLKDKMAAAETD